MKARLWGTCTICLICCTVILLPGCYCMSNGLYVYPSQPGFHLNDMAFSLIEVLEGLTRMARAVIYSSNVSLTMSWLSHFRNPHHLCVNSFDGNRACFCLFSGYMKSRAGSASLVNVCVCVNVCRLSLGPCLIIAAGL